MSAGAYADALGASLAADQNQDLTTALLNYVAAIGLASPSDGDTARTDLYQMIAQHGMPHLLTATQVKSLQAAPGPFTVKTAQFGITILGLDGGAGRSLDSLGDPQNQWPFPALAAIYAPGAGDATKSVLVCSVHYQIKEDIDFAEHTGRLLALLRAALIQRSGQMPAYESPFNVWLARSASSTPGGEQWRNNLYLYNIGDGRSSIEWIREIAHEYSHLALPPLGGDYTDPEAWANGYVGERLLVRWLADPAIAGKSVVESVWGRTFEGYANFKAKLIDPPERDFVRAGLIQAELARKDGEGMRYVIGLALWVDDHKGGHALGNLLWNMESPESPGLYAPAKQIGAPTSPSGQ